MDTPDETVIRLWDRRRRVDYGDGVIYFIGAWFGPIKIGHTYDVKRRLVALQNGSPFELKVYGAVPGNLRDEKRIHADLDQHRFHGEWFDRQQAFDALRAMQPAPVEKKRPITARRAR